MPYLVKRVEKIVGVWGFRTSTIKGIETTVFHVHVLAKIIELLLRYTLQEKKASKN